MIDLICNRLTSWCTGTLIFGLPNYQRVSTLGECALLYSRIISLGIRKFPGVFVRIIILRKMIKYASVPPAGILAMALYNCMEGHVLAQHSARTELKAGEYMTLQQLKYVITVAETGTIF